MRSQMAAAFARYHGGERVFAESFGTAPAERIAPVVIEAMAEKGIDMAHLKPAPREAVSDKDALVVRVGVGGDDSGGAERWKLPADPEMDLEAARRLRDDIEKRVQALLGGLPA